MEATWASERMANAVLRERINDVAGEVVRVAHALEGLGSPIETMLAGKASELRGRAGPQETEACRLNDSGGEDSKGSLATASVRCRSVAARVAAGKCRTVTICSQLNGTNCRGRCA